MTTEGFWRADRFLELVIALLLLTTIKSIFIQNLERGAHKFGVLPCKRLSSSRVLLIRVHKLSIATVARRPSPGRTLANLIGSLARSGADALGCPGIVLGSNAHSVRASAGRLT
jgi:hypothetical protein